MFETMSGFMWFFIPALALILGGIAYEDKLIALEDKVFTKIKERIEKNG